NLLRQLGDTGELQASASWSFASGAQPVTVPEAAFAGLGSAASVTASSIPDNNARVDLDLDLGSVWSVGAVRQLYVPGHTPDTARLELSLDGVDWTTVVPNQEPPGDDFRWLIYPPVEARHLRLTLIGISAA